MNDALQQFLQIGIVGIGLSFVIEMIKSRNEISSMAVKGLVVILSLVLGLGYYFLVGSTWYEPVVGILSAATIFYAFFIKE